jgi:1-deoxy-D-xylulose-5-phosphate reductoisomerase
MATPAGDRQPFAQATPDRHVLILGSTGSIGRQALEVLAAMPGAKLAGIAAHSNWKLALEQAAARGTPVVGLQSEDAAREASPRADDARVEILTGDVGIAELIARAADEARVAGLPLVVLNGIVGAAGLRATIAALDAGATLALANKESLVAGGQFVVAAARAGGARVIPVDSEHSALFQCLGGREDGDASAVEELLLTGSGGPFRTWSAERLVTASPEQALAHPTWSMGPKITIDSATLMNKGLEVIEAHHLFGVAYERVMVLLSPQSIVHSMVRFSDGAILAHLGVPDMRTPIGYALSWPVRPALPMVKRLDLLAAELSFERPDLERFPCLRLAIDAGRAAARVEAKAGCATGLCVESELDERPVQTSASPIVLNAANEVAVQGFLAGRIGFTDIPPTVEKCLTWLGDAPVERLGDVFEVDREARRFAEETVASRRMRR